MDVRGYIIHRRFVTVESLRRISSGTIFLWNCMAPQLQGAGEGRQSASKAQLSFNHLASQELAPQKLWTCAGADLLNGISVVGSCVATKQDWAVEIARERAQSGLLAISCFFTPSQTIFKAFFRIHQICNCTMLFPYEEEFWRIFIFLGELQWFCKWLVRFISFQCCYFCWELCS